MLLHSTSSILLLRLTNLQDIFLYSCQQKSRSPYLLTNLIFLLAIVLLDFPHVYWIPKLINQKQSIK